VDNPSDMRGRAVQVACDLPVFEALPGIESHFPQVAE
jgi:hypothetical protein